MVQNMALNQDTRIVLLILCNTKEVQSHRILVSEKTISKPSYKPSISLRNTIPKEMTSFSTAGSLKKGLSHATAANLCENQSSCN